MADRDDTSSEIANPRDLPPPKALRRKESPERDIKTAAERLSIEQARAPGLATKLARLAAGVGLTALLFVGAYFVLSAFDSDSSKDRAPWGNPGAPIVKPYPLSKQ